MPPHRDNIPAHTLQKSYHFAATIATSLYLKSWFLCGVGDRTRTFAWRLVGSIGATPPLLLPGSGFSCHPWRHGIPRLTRQPTHVKEH